MEATLKQPSKGVQTSLLTERNEVKADKKELNGRIYDLQFDKLSQPNYDAAVKKVNDDHMAMDKKFHDHMEEVHQELISTNQKIKEMKEAGKAKVEKAKADTVVVSDAEVNAAKQVYDDALKKENDAYNAKLNEHKTNITQIKTEAKAKDQELKKNYQDLKAMPMKRAEKAERLDHIKSEIYGNSGTASIEVADIEATMKKEAAQHSKNLEDMKNAYDLKANPVATKIKNAKAEVKEEIRPYREKATALRDNYGQVANPIYQFGLYWRHWGIKFAQKSVVSFTTKKGFADWLIHNAVYIIIVAMVVVTAIVKPSWLNFTSLVAIIKHTAALLPLALGVAGTIVLTGTDLSLGKIWGLTALLSGAFLGYASTNGVIYEWTANMPWIWILAVLILIMCVGGILGGINGYFVAEFSIHPFIVTLATQLIIYGIILLYGNLTNISVIYQGTSNMASMYNSFVTGGFYIGKTLIEWYNLYAVLLMIIIWFIWNKTQFGKAMFAVGCNPDAANVSGINVKKTIFMVFVLAGICYGIAGFEYNPINGGAQLSTGTGGELDPITAAVIGGVSFTGGIGKVSGVLLGCVLLKVIDSCLLALGLSTAYINIIKGCIILIAVALDMKKYIVKK